MLYKKQQLILVAVLLSAGAHFIPVSYDKNLRMTARGLVRNVRKIDPMKLNEELLKKVDFSKIFKDLHQHLSPEEVRMVSTLGLVTGVLRAEESMREHLYILTDDLLESFNSKKPKDNMGQLIVIEQTINRDKYVVKVLNEMMKYARNATSLDSMQTEFLAILKENEDAKKRVEIIKSEMDEEFGSELKFHMKERLYEIREMIDNHVEQIHTSITEGAKQTLKFIQMMQKNNPNVRQRPISTDIVKLDPSLFVVRRLWDQVASANDSSKTNDFGVAINYQPRSSVPPITKVQQSPPVKKIQEEEKQPRITKGEEEEIMAIITKADDKQIMTRTSRNGEQSEKISHSTPATMVKLVVVNAKMDRFKRKTKTVNGKMDVDPFDLSVDIDFNDDEDYDGDKTKKETNEKNQKDTDNDNNPNKDKDKEKEKGKDEDKDAKSNDNEVEGFGDDEYKSENQDAYLPLQGGLAGLIQNLSGGAMGSDIGSVVAALSSVLNNLFGPGGIDLQGIVGTGATLLASLIGGDENFGKVLANIVGLAIDGLSGGGGADRNGQFFGQFVGRFISILSADPEDPDEEPLRPDLFIENVYDGIAKGSAQTPDPDAEDGGDRGLNKEPNFGLDSSSFIKRSIGGLFSVITSASTSASAGLSQHSASASTDTADHAWKGSVDKVKNKFFHKDKDHDDDKKDDE